MSAGDAPKQPRPLDLNRQAPGRSLLFCDLTQSYAATGGGIRTYIHAKRRFLLAHTSHRHLLIVPGEKDTVTYEGRATTITLRSPRVPRSPAYRLLLRNGAVRSALDAHRPDVVECLDAYNLPWAALAYRRRRPAVAVIGGYRTDFPRAYAVPAARAVASRLLPERWRRRFAKRVEANADDYAGRLYARMDRVYALGRPMASHLESLGVQRVATLPLGVDLDCFHPDRRNAKIRVDLGATPDGPPLGRPLLIYAGRLDQEKRPDLVVDAFARLPVDLNAALVLAGDGPLREPLERRARTLTAEGRTVHVLGFVHDRDHLARLLASADVYVSAMPHETFGISIVEAQASGLPVVGVHSGAMPERVPAELGRLVRPGDANALAEALMSVLAAGPVEIGARARKMVQAHYSWDKTFERLFHIYDEAIACRSRRRSRFTPP